MRSRMLVSLLAVLVWPMTAWAQAVEVGSWSFRPSLAGSTNRSGTVMRLDADVAYGLSEHIRAYGGVPVFIVRQSVGVAPGGDPQYLGGIGDIYGGLEIPIEGETADFRSDIRLTVPTGEEDHGLSSQEITVAWHNTFSRSFGPIAPYGTFGVGNTIPDTDYLVRPFTSRGLMTHFEGGAVLNVLPRLELGGSAYTVRASGDQRIFSRVLDRPVVTGPGPFLGSNGRVFERSAETTVPASLANDHGYNAWIGLRPEAPVAFRLGYSHSAGYGLDSVSFGVDFGLDRF